MKVQNQYLQLSDVLSFPFFIMEHPWRFSFRFVVITNYMLEESDGSSTFLMEENKLALELEKQFERESTFLFEQLKRKLEDDILKDNKQLSETISVCFCSLVFTILTTPKILFKQ